MNPAAKSTRWRMIRSAWSRFWFQPTDPTPLGLMRIVTGAMLLYVHLAYCLELDEFFGPAGWLSQEAANRERKEQPNFASPLDWRQVAGPPRLPESPQRRAAALEFLRRLPDEPSERMRRLIVISTLKHTIAEIEDRRRFFNAYAKIDEVQRETFIAAIASRAKELPLALPAFLQTAEPRTILAHLAEADALRGLLPPPGNPMFDYVVDWFQDLSTPELLRVMTFIEELPRSPGDRLDIINYMEFWNTDPRLVYARGRYVFSVWFHIRGLTAMKVAHGIALIIFFLFTIGLWTRVTSVLSWLALLCYIHRTPPVLFGMDTMMSILMLYLMIGPSGAALSVDRLRARFRAAKAIGQSPGKTIAWAETSLRGPQPSSLANLALRLFQVHFCLIYTSTGLAKLKGGSWWDTTAGWMVLMNPGFSLIHERYFEQIILWISSTRLLWALMCGSLVVFTLTVEILLPVLVWTRLRPYFVIGSTFLHSGIAFVMGLAPFGLLMMTLLLAFFPASVIRQAPAWVIRRGKPFTVRFNPAIPGHQRLINFIRAVDVAGQATLQPVPAKEVTVHSAHGTFPADTLFKMLALLRPITWIPGISRVLRLIYW